MNKKLLSILLASIMTSTLTSCNNGGTTTPKSTGVQVENKSIWDTMYFVRDYIFNPDRIEAEKIKISLRQLDPKKDIVDQQVKVLNKIKNFKTQYPDSYEVHDIDTSTISAMDEDKFIHDSKVSILLAHDLKNIYIVNDYYQTKLRNYIVSGKFGLDTETLVIMFDNIFSSKLNITTDITKALNDGVFGYDPKVWATFTKNFHLIQDTGGHRYNNEYLNLETKQTAYLIEMIDKGKFNNYDQGIMNNLVDALITLPIPLYSDYQLGDLIHQGKLKADLQRLSALAKKLDPQNHADWYFRRFGVFHNSHNTIMALADNNFISFNEATNTYIPQHGNKNNTQIPEWFAKYHLFGKLGVYDAYNPPKLDVGNSMNFEDALGLVNGVNANNMLAYGSFGITYDTNNKPDLLIIMAHAVDNTHSQDYLAEQIAGFLNIQTKTPRDIVNIYAKVMTYLRIYDLKSHPKYPVIITNLDSNSAYFERFPKWLKKNIKIIEGNDKENIYTDKVLKFVEVLPDNESKELIITSIKRIINHKGNSIKLDQDNNKDQELKMKINTYLSEFYSNKPNLMVQQLDNVWSGFKNKDDKLKFIYLLGQIAKSGSLGYHYKQDNQANELYYTLTKLSAKKLYNEDQTVPGLASLINGLDNAHCVEVVTNSFMIVNPTISDVWLD